MRENTLSAGALGHASLLFPSFPSSGIEQERKETFGNLSADLMEGNWPRIVRSEHA
jgi:hypothetical protein